MLSRLSCSQGRMESNHGGPTKLTLREKQYWGSRHCGCNVLKHAQSPPWTEKNHHMYVAKKGGSTKASLLVAP